MWQTNWQWERLCTDSMFQGCFFKGSGLLFFLYSCRLSLNDVMLSSSEVSISPSFESYNKYFFLPVNMKLLLTVHYIEMWSYSR